MTVCPEHAAVLGERGKQSRMVSGDGTLCWSYALFSSRESWKLTQRNQFTNTLQTEFPPKGVVIFQHLSPVPSPILHLSCASTSISMSML